MDETTITASSDILVTPVEHVPSALSIPDDVQGQETPSADILAMPERLNEVPDWLRTPLRRLPRPLSAEQVHQLESCIQTAITEAKNDRIWVLAVRDLACFYLHRQLSGVPVTAQRLRHTFASQMLGAGMPVSSLQRYLGHEYLDTTMVYAKVSDPLLRQDYYQGIAAFDISSKNQPTNELAESQQDLLRQLVKELKTPDLEPTRRDKILDQMQRLLENED